jgi:hypothetical protein
MREFSGMRYAILCYDLETVTGAWSREEDDAVIGRLQVVQRKFAAEGKLGPVARLMPTTAATTLRKGAETVIFDGPFAETKEQLLGFYILDCDSLEEALDAAKQLAEASTHGSGSYEVRPVMMFHNGDFAT